MEYLQFLEPWMIPIVIMICVTVIVIVSSVTTIITTSIKEKNRSGELTENKEFLNALREFKENMDSRVQNLEKIAAAENPAADRSKNRVTQKQSSIEFDLDDNRTEKEALNPPSKLKNMLNK
ncbi:MAG: hypothetical protein U5K72_01475 [Balneolaceae bacterium]|nr:hypothetical protein [Balneolaceae bacterium]